MRKIVLRDAQANGQEPISFSVSYVFRLRAPSNRIIPKPTATSAVVDATEEEIAALRSGEFVESSGNSQNFETETFAEVLEVLRAAYETAQENANAAAAPFDFILAAWDGVSWSRHK